MFQPYRITRWIVRHPSGNHYYEIAIRTAALKAEWRNLIGA